MAEGRAGRLVVRPPMAVEVGGEKRKEGEKEEEG